MDGTGTQVGEQTRRWALLLAAGVLGVGAVTGAWDDDSPPLGQPTPGHEASAVALGAPPLVPFPGTGYRFLDLQDDGRTPVAWDPCRPVHYVVREAGSPPGGRELIEAAVGQISAATGLRFVADGATDESPSPARPGYQPQRYGDRWAPVLIAWQTAAENSDFATDVVGQARSLSMTSPGRPAVYVTGQVSLDAETLAAQLTAPGGSALARAVIVHELGHLVGLGHVDQASEIMYPRANRVITELGPGDRTGLARLGHGPCVPEL